MLALIAGFLFAVGLAYSGMTQPGKVIGFLDFFGNWDPSLFLVMGSAVPVYMLGYRLVNRMKTPLFGGRFGIPSRSDLDARLLWGAALFGAGWGIGGFCPGPALAGLVTGATEVLLFVLSMLVGMMAFKTWDEFSSSARR
jgi:uncharacterized membrane protein YedE/YeeE